MGSLGVLFISTPLDLEMAVRDAPTPKVRDPLTGALYNPARVDRLPRTDRLVVKPNTAPDNRRVQPGLKCRGREYLRIVYGPDYDEPERLARLRKRSLGRKRSLAHREHALGLAALDAVAAGQPLWTVHRYVFAILASESEPVDPRL